MICKSLAALAVAHAFFTPPTFSGDAACTTRESQVATSEFTKAVLGDLPKELSEISSVSAITLPKLLGRLLDEYFAIHYSAKETAAVLKDLAQLLVAPKLDSALLSEPACGEDPSEASGQAPLILFVDPTCGYCHDAATLLLRLRRTCPESVPPIAFRLSPSPDPTSRRVAAMLERMRLKRSQFFCTAVLDALRTVQSGHPETLDTFVADYRSLISELGSDSASEPPQVPVQLAGLDPPFAVLGRRILVRKRMFNPFGGESEALTSIILLGAAHGN